MSRTRTVVQRVAGLLAVALLAASCSGSGSGQTLDDLDGTEPADRSANQDIRVAVGEDPFLQNNNRNLGLLNGGPNPGIFDTLTRLNPGFAVVPSLALRWDTPTPREWRFTLREDVTFHDGQPLNAVAVVANLETLAARQNHPRGLVPGAATVAGPFEVQVNLSLDNARLAEQLANPALGIEAPGTSAGLGDSPQTTATGTGPFAFESYDAGQSLKVVANDSYWGGAPILRSITFRFGLPADAGLLLATRQVEAVGHIAHPFLPALSGRTDQLVLSRPARAVYVLLNAGGIGDFATLQETNVRKAVSMAIDREVIADTAWPDFGEPNDSLVPELVLGADSAARVRPPPRDVDGARRLLGQAGWAPGPDGIRVRNGTSLVLTLVLAQPDEQATAIEPLRKSLADVGIGLDVPDLGGENPFLRLVGATFDLFIDSRAQEDGNPCALCRFFTLEQGGTVNFAASVGGGPMADELFARAYSSPSVDSAKRLAADLMNVVITDRATAVPLATLRSEWLVSPRVQAFEPAALRGDQRWDKVWLSM